VLKVLNGYRKRDERSAKYHYIKPDEAFDFVVFEEDGLVKLGGEKRIKDLRGSVKWALSRALERSEVSA